MTDNIYKLLLDIQFSKLNETNNHEICSKISKLILVLLTSEYFAYDDSTSLEDEDSDYYFKIINIKYTDDEKEKLEKLQSLLSSEDKLKLIREYLLPKFKENFIDDLTLNCYNGGVDTDYTKESINDFLMFDSSIRSLMLNSIKEPFRSDRIMKSGSIPPSHRYILRQQANILLYQYKVQDKIIQFEEDFKEIYESILNNYIYIQIYDQKNFSPNQIIGFIFQRILSGTLCFNPTSLNVLQLFKELSKLHIHNDKNSNHKLNFTKLVIEKVDKLVETLSNSHNLCEQSIYINYIMEIVFDYCEALYRINKKYLNIIFMLLKSTMLKLNFESVKTINNLLQIGKDNKSYNPSYNYNYNNVLPIYIKNSNSFLWEIIYPNLSPEVKNEFFKALVEIWNATELIKVKRICNSFEYSLNDITCGKYFKLFINDLSSYVDYFKLTIKQLIFKIRV